VQEKLWTHRGGQVKNQALIVGGRGEAKKSSEEVPDSFNFHIPIVAQDNAQKENSENEVKSADDTPKKEEPKV
jgi:hypothetical protein